MRLSSITTAAIVLLLCFSHPALAAQGNPPAGQGLGAGPNLSNMPVEDAIQYMFMAISEDARKDQKALMEEMERTRLEKQALRDAENSVKAKMRAEHDAKLRRKHEEHLARLKAKREAIERRQKQALERLRAAKAKDDAEKRERLKAKQDKREEWHDEMKDRRRDRVERLKAEREEQEARRERLRARRQAQHEQRQAEARERLARRRAERIEAAERRREAQQRRAERHRARQQAQHDGKKGADAQSLQTPCIPTLAKPCPPKPASNLQPRKTGSSFGTVGTQPATQQKLHLAPQPALKPKGN